MTPIWPFDILRVCCCWRGTWLLKESRFTSTSLTRFFLGAGISSQGRDTGGSSSSGMGGTSASPSSRRVSLTGALAGTGSESPTTPLTQDVEPTLFSMFRIISRRLKRLSNALCPSWTPHPSPPMGAREESRGPRLGRDASVSPSSRISLAGRARCPHRAGCASERPSGALGTDAPYPFSFTSTHREPSPATHRTPRLIRVHSCSFVVSPSHV